jgi:hypothetical protein
MTTMVDLDAPPPALVPSRAPTDHRGSWIPTPGMIATRILELRKRRGLMIALVLVDIGIPTLFLLIRLLTHALAPKSYGPAGGADIFEHLVAQIMFVFGFIVAATLGATAGSSDLTDGMFRHLVVTGRSRLALYLARIPAGLAIVWTLLATGFTVVCVVCVFAAPTQINYNGTPVPAGLSLSGFEHWAAAHPADALCAYQGQPPNGVNIACGPNGPLTPSQIQNIGSGQNGPNGPVTVINGKVQSGGPPQDSSPAALKAAAVQVAPQEYSGYKVLFLYPSNSFMIKSGLWLELEATIGFMVGLGLGSLIGQRTVPVILMIVLEIILTPIISMHVIPHLLNLQRAVVGLATAHLEPAGLPLTFGGGGGPNGNSHVGLVPESTTVAICVIVAWLVGWTALGAWRMVRRDA